MAPTALSSRFLRASKCGENRTPISLILGVLSANLRRRRRYAAP